MIGSYDIKSDLKSVLRECLGNQASDTFFKQSFALIDQSAPSKESFLVAADRISKRVALFIDKSLSQPVYDRLLALIGASDSPEGIRRRFPRVAFHQNVLVKHKGKSYELIAENISEGGIFLKTDKTLPITAVIEMILSLRPGHTTVIKGTVVNKRSFFRGLSESITGVGIEFKEVDKETADLLRDYTQKLYTE